MKAVLFVSLALFVASAFSLAPLLHTDSASRIEGQYIVVLHRNATSQHLKDFHASVSARLPAAAGNNRLLFTETVEIETQFKCLLVAIEDEQLLNSIRMNPLVQYVEIDQTVSIEQTCEVQETSLWNLDRISETLLDLDGFYHYEGQSGDGVDVYILDTGVYLQHTGFGGRAIFGWSAFTDQNDGNGHGTHVAGTVGSTTWGVAKKTTLIAIKVLDNSGSGSWAGVISGVGQTTTMYRTRGKPSVANMSLGGGISTAVDDSVKDSIAAGVSYAVAAGNSNANACNYSPANVREAITAGSTTSTDNRSSFSNFGTCVDVFAPGSTITSAWIGNPNAILTISGTSMASPHVAGIAALILHNNPQYTPANVKQALQASATNGLVINPGAGSPNLLAYASC